MHFDGISCSIASGTSSTGLRNKNGRSQLHGSECRLRAHTNLLHRKGGRN